MQNKPATAFTIRSNGGRLGVLQTPIKISLPNTQTSIQINGIWDTGATNSAITQRVIDALGLLPIGQAEVNTANGTVIQSTYFITISVANVNIAGITATGVDALSGNCDALIGMDVITMGDLSITSFKGNTCMSFRMPSCHEIDFTKNINFGVVQNKLTISTAPSRNGPCPCGSGKIYKRCCGLTA